MNEYDAKHGKMSGYRYGDVCYIIRYEETGDGWYVGAEDMLDLIAVLQELESIEIDEQQA